MPTFIVESYGAAGAVAEQRTRAEQAAELGPGIRYIRTTVMPADQVLLHLFEAASTEALRAAVAAVELDCDRIVEALEGRRERRHHRTGVEMIRKSLLAFVLTAALSAAATAVAPAANAGTKIVPLSAGTFHTCGITPTGGVMCWGAGGDGALGNGAYDNSNVPVAANVAGGTVAAISAGWYHTCAVTTAGGGRCWGDNTGGQLGDGTTDETAVPTPVVGYEDFGLEAISGGAFHTCAIAGGQVTCWGANSFGQLGTGDTTASKVPVPNPTLTVGVSAIAAGHSHTCAIASGDVWCWGDNAYGQLGDGTQIERHEPVRVQGLNVNAIAVVTGDSHTCVLLVGGAVQCWGDNGYGQLGDGTFDPSASPRQVTGLDADVTAISSRGNTTCALRTGAVLCWGDNLRGQVGDGTSNNARGEPVGVVGLSSGVAEIAAGYYHSCALTTGGVVRCWGWNNFGQLGDGTNTNSTVPVGVGGAFGPLAVTVDDISADEGDGGSHGSVFTVTLSAPGATSISVDYRTVDGTATAGSDYTAASGTLTFAPGETTKTIAVDVIGDTDAEGDETFQLNLSNATGAAISDDVGFATITDDDALVADAVGLEVGYRHACALRGGGATCWGANDEGQLGDGTTGESHAPVPVVGLPSNAIAVTAGNAHSCAMTADGGARCWGANAAGQLGDGSLEGNATPIQVSGLTSGVVAISAGNVHTCALLDDGSVKCWGSSDSGQLGGGFWSGGPISTPIDVVDLRGRAIAITAGGSHTCALTTTGVVWCWGAHVGGIWGLPTIIVGLPSDVTSIGAGGGHTCAVTSSGQVWCWGDNQFGQLGNGTSGAGTSSDTPVQVTGLAGPVQSVTAGFFHTCALTTVGRVQCWGANIAGRLGDGTTTNSPVPVQVIGMTSGIEALAAGGNQTCAKPSALVIRCWGTNVNGQLGDGTTTERHTPVDVIGYGPQLSVDDQAVNEGGVGSRAVTFTITLSEPTIAPVTVNYATVNDTATAPRDYASISGTLTFAGGETVRHLAVLVHGDPTFEADEIFNLVLSGASDAAIADGRGVATIRNDDSLAVTSVLIDTGGRDSCAVTSTAHLKCWGSNNQGQIGDGTEIDRTVAVNVANVSDVAAVGVGDFHACALTNAGGVLCWGGNRVGQIGDGTDEQRSTAVAVEGLQSGVVAISVGGIHSCALMELGTVECWGDNADGTLGDGTAVFFSAHPVRVAGLTGIVAVAAGEGSSCALDVGGQVWCWGGGNAVGSLGDGTGVDSGTPVAVQGLPADVATISIGLHHACAATRSGGVWCWGWNASGQIGDATNTSRLTAAPVSGLASGVIQISAGGASTCALVTGGVTKCWGRNDHGQLGDGSVQDRSTPVEVPIPTGVTALATGAAHSCALLLRITVLCWGDNANGDLGNGSTAESAFLVSVLNFGPAVSVRDVTMPEGGAGGGGAVMEFRVTLSEPAGIPFEVPYETESGTATAGFDFSSKSGYLTFPPGETVGSINVGVFDDADLEPDETFRLRLCCSADGHEVIGVATITNDDHLETLSAPIDGGGQHTCAVTPAGGLACWGWNGHGQLGDGTGVTDATAGAVGVIDLDGEAVAVSAGQYHSCAVMLFGQVQCWGLNDSGQLGDGTTTTRLGPVDVDVPGGAAGVAAGYDHTCAVTRTGHVLCWGRNVDGQTGQTPGSNITTPVEVPGLDGVRMVVAGNAHTCALTLGGGVLCWGQNAFGQLGDGTTTGGPSPVPVTGLSSGVTAIAAAGHHTCALTTAGGLTCWGDNQYGQLGANSSAFTSPIPLDVVGLSHGVVSVAAGEHDTCAVTSGGAVWCWGDNVFGELGSATYGRTPSPVPVAAITSGATRVAAGEFHSCVMLDNDLIKCWGNGGVGELGRCLPGGTEFLCPYSSRPVDVLGWGSDLAIHDASLIEGDGVGVATFRVTLTKPSARQITVDYATHDGTATAGSDYLATSGTLDFAPGETTKDIDIAVIGDIVGEPDEQFQVLLDHPVNGALATDVGVGTLTNDDETVTVSIDDISILEGNTGLSSGAFTVTLSEPSAETVTVDWETVGDSAGDVDYVADEGTLTFPPGTTSQTITVNIRGDSEAEDPEDFWVALSSPTNARLVKETGVVRIIDDDGTLLSIHDSSVVEGDTGTTPITFRVSHSAPSRSTITVDYLTFTEQATSGTDFVFARGTVTFAPFDMEEQITIDVIGDTTIEPDERFQVALVNPVGASIEEGVGEGTIVNDDVPAISITDASVTEGNTGSNQAALTVSLSASIPATVTVRYETAESSATAAADFGSASGTLSFAPGETAKEIRVDVKGDTLDEPNESFAVELANATNATIADSTGIVTIADDDAPPTLSVNDVSIREGDTGTAPLVFTVNLSAPSGKTVSVSVATGGGTATARTDYMPTSATVSIAAGATTVGVSVPIRGDVADENNETFNLSLSSPSNATIADGTGVGTIIDDDPKPVISYFQPNIVAIGDTVAIRGSAFTGATAVQFIPMGGGPIPTPFFQVVNDSKISVLVPHGATTGRVWVTTPNGLAISPVDLLLQPKITAIGPVAGPEGSIVTIYGSGFFGATSVRFGSTPSAPIPVSDTIMMTIVPQGAKSSRIQVITPAGVATSADVFTVFVLPPPPPPP